MNLQTRIGSKVLSSLILCLWILFTAQSAEAGPLLPGSGFGENAEAFQVLVMHGPINASANHVFLNVNNAKFWEFTISIAENDRNALGLTDVLQVQLTGLHKAGVPGHVGEGRNDAGIVFNFTTAVGPFAPGANNRARMQMIDHPPIAGHMDKFAATLTFTVAMDGLSITDYKIEFSGTHCFPQCPALPPTDKQLQEVPEWDALMLFGSGLVGLLGYNWRRKNVWLRQRKR